MRSYVVLGAPGSSGDRVADGLRRTQVSMGKRFLPCGPLTPDASGIADLDFLEVNQRVLRSAGVSWKDAGGEAAVQVAAVEHMGAARRLINSKAAEGGDWGFWDQRTPITYPLWEPLLPADTHLVCVFRRPFEAASELMAWHGAVSAQRALQLVLRYDRAVLDAAARFVGLE